jgi:hypothetical protein
VLYLGAIPVVEKQAGYTALFEGLPVLQLDSFESITSQLLVREYTRIQRRAAQDSYDFSKLTKKFWLDRLMLAAGNRTCNFADKSPCFAPYDLSNCTICTDGTVFPRDR